MQRYLRYLSLIKFSHTVFALPFALAALVYVSQRYAPNSSDFVLILIAMIAARTAAMAFNRLVDRDFDRDNPRTALREIPSGEISPRRVQLLVAVSAAVFFLASYGLGVHCLIAAPVVLIILCGYSYVKRFSALAHYVLGIALGLAPMAVYYVFERHVPIEAAILGGAVMFWVAGFDIIYSCLDREFDTRAGLHSMPVLLGETRARLLSSCSHIIAIILLYIYGYLEGARLPYNVGLVVFAVIVAYQHIHIAKVGIKNCGESFFTLNGYAALIWLLFVCCDRL